MKETIVSLLQQRMDKCTKEQFWAVASLTAADGYLISEWEKMAGALLPYIALAFVSSLTVYGVWFIISRHHAYYRNRRALVELLKDEECAPDFLKKSPQAPSWNSASGVVFYIAWLTLCCVACFVRAFV